MNRGKCTEVEFQNRVHARRNDARSMLENVSGMSRKVLDRNVRLSDLSLCAVYQSFNIADEIRDAVNPPSRCLVESREIHPSCGHVEKHFLFLQHPLRCHSHAL